ncbi:MAG: hypothetical protein ACREUW_17515 [Burkholderiales bacterium]
MSLLDDLKKQADSLRQQQEVSEEQINQNLLAVNVKLKEALAYWVEMFNSLNVIKPVVARTYFLDSGSIQLEAMNQHDYNVNGRRKTIDHHDYIEGVVLRLRCVSEQKISVTKESDAHVERLREHLWSHNVKFEVKEVRNERGYVERGHFTVLPDVPVMVTLFGDFERGHIRIHTKNLEKFGEFHYVYDIAEFGREISEELAKMILGQPNNLRTLGSHQQALRPSNSASRISPAAAAPQPPQLDPEHEPDAQPMMDPSDPARSFMGSLRHLLKR